MKKKLTFQTPPLWRKKSSLIKTSSYAIEDQFSTWRKSIWMQSQKNNNFLLKFTIKFEKTDFVLKLKK